MKSFLFDLVATQPNSSGKRHGGGKYGEMIFFRMVERCVPFSCVYNSRHWLNPEIEEVCKQKNITLYDCRKISIGEIVRTNNIERIYSALPGKWFFEVPKSCEIYGTLHGLRSLETPKDNYFLKYNHSFRDVLKFLVGKMLPKLWEKYIRNNYMQRYFNSNMKIITVSEHSRMAIYSYFPDCRTDIRVFYSPNTSCGGGGIC